MNRATARPPALRTPTPHDEGLRTHWLVTIPAVALGMFLSVLDLSVAGVANSAIQKDLGANNDDIQWVTTAYKLSLGVGLPLSVWLSDRFGLRRVYLAGVAAFGISAGLCGLATTLPMLIGFRVLEGFPGGMMPVICMSILQRVMPTEKMPAASMAYAMVVISAPAFSPVLGGLFVEYLSWRLNFLVTVPLAGLGLLLGSLLLPRLPARGTPRFDLGGFVSLAVGLFALLLALSQGYAWGWTSVAVLALVALGTNALALFVIIELQVEQPLIDLRVFTNLTFVVGVVMLETLFIGVNALLSFVPSFLQSAQSITPTNSGLVMLALGLTWMLSIPVAGRVYGRFGPAGPATAGLTIMGIGFLLLIRLNVDLPRPGLMVILALMATGLAVSVISLMGGSVSRLPPELADSGLVLRTVAQRVAPALGLGLINGWLYSQRAQIMAGRSNLLNPATAPRLYAAGQLDPSATLPQWQQMQYQVSAQAYSNVFLVLGLILLLAALLPFVVRWGRTLTTAGLVRHGA